MTELFQSHQKLMTHSLNLLVSRDPMTVQALSVVSPSSPIAPIEYASMTDEAEAARYDALTSNDNEGLDDDGKLDRDAFAGVFG